MRKWNNRGERGGTASCEETSTAIEITQSVSRESDRTEDGTASFSTTRRGSIFLFLGCLLFPQATCGVGRRETLRAQVPGGSAQVPITFTWVETLAAIAQGASIRVASLLPPLPGACFVVAGLFPSCAVTSAKVQTRSTHVPRASPSVSGPLNTGFTLIHERAAVIFSVHIILFSVSVGVNIGFESFPMRFESFLTGLAGFPMGFARFRACVGSFAGLRPSGSA